MSIELSEVMRVRAISEATFGTDETGSLGSFVDVPFRADSLSWTTDREMLDPMTSRQRVDRHDLKVLGWRRGTLTMTHNLAPTGVAAGDSTPQVQPQGLGLLLRIGMGGENLATGASVDPAATVNQVDVTGGANLDPGAMVGLHPGAGTLPIEARQLTSGASSTSLRIDLSGAPASGTDMYGAATYYLTQDPAESAQFVVEGAEADDGWVFLGCQLDSITFDFPMGQIPTVTMNWKCAGYLLASEAAGTIGAATLATYSNYQPIITEGPFLWIRQPDGTTPTNPDECIAAFTLNFNLTYAEVPCPSGVNGVYRWRRTRSVPVASGSWRTWYEDEESWTDWHDRVTRGVMWQLGETAGFMVVVDLPRVQLGPVQRVDGDGLASEEVSFEAHEDIGNTGANSSTDLSFSALRISFL